MIDAQKLWFEKMSRMFINSVYMLMVLNKGLGENGTIPFTPHVMWLKKVPFNRPQKKLEQGTELDIPLDCYNRKKSS